MSGACGPRGIGSSRNFVLTWSLASRLQARLVWLGSTLFSLTWKVRTTPSGRSIFALRASGRRISDSGFSSWGMPVVNNATGSQYAYSQGRHNKIVLKLPGAAQLSTWPTPKASDCSGGRANRDGGRRQRASGQGCEAGELGDASGAGWRTRTCGLQGRGDDGAAWPATDLSARPRRFSRCLDGSPPAMAAS